MSLPPPEDTFVGFGAPRALRWRGPQSRSLAEWFRGTGLESRVHASRAVFSRIKTSGIAGIFSTHYGGAYRIIPARPSPSVDNFVDSHSASLRDPALPMLHEQQVERLSDQLPLLAAGLMRKVA